uniref:Uncharacterized protein n=1 Tax=Strongyloides papillosus TaxID=174720 RepID=A0A0N5BD66_STREA
MNLSSVDETIKRPTTAISQPKVNLNTRLRPLDNKSTFNGTATSNNNLYNQRLSFSSTLPSNKLLTRYNTRKVTNVSMERQRIYPLSPLEKLNLPQMYGDNSTSTYPAHLNVESFSHSTRHTSGNVPKKSIVSSAKYSTSGIQRKLTTKNNSTTLKKTKIKDFLRKKSKITLKCFCILILLLIPIAIFVIMIVYSSSLELDKPRETPKKSPL